MIDISLMNLMNRYYTMPAESVGGKKKRRTQGTLVGCAKCGRMGVTLYGGAVKLCRECKKREGRQGSLDKG